MHEIFNVVDWVGNKIGGPFETHSEAEDFLITYLDDAYVGFRKNYSIIRIEEKNND